MLLDFLPLVYKSYYASEYLDLSLPFDSVYGQAAVHDADLFSGSLASISKLPVSAIKYVDRHFYFIRVSTPIDSSERRPWRRPTSCASEYRLLLHKGNRTIIVALRT